MEPKRRLTERLRLLADGQLQAATAHRLTDSQTENRAQWEVTLLGSSNRPRDCFPQRLTNESSPRPRSARCVRAHSDRAVDSVGPQTKTRPNRYRWRGISPSVEAVYCIARAAWTYQDRPILHYQSRFMPFHACHFMLEVCEMCVKLV